MEGGELEDRKGSRQLSRYRRTRSNWLPLLLIAIFVVTIIMIVPVFPVTQIHIQIDTDYIQNVWVETSNRNLISPFFSPSNPLGAYTINVSIVSTVGISKNFSIQNVPIGEYTIVWQSGTPANGSYTIKVDLYRIVFKNSFSIHVSY